MWSAINELSESKVNVIDTVNNSFSLRLVPDLTSRVERMVEVVGFLCNLQVQHIFFFFIS